MTEKEFLIAIISLCQQGKNYTIAGYIERYATARLMVLAKKDGHFSRAMEMVERYDETQAVPDPMKKGISLNSLREGAALTPPQQTLHSLD